MTITMTAKHQVTIPKKIANALGLKKGAMFNVEVFNNRIELAPLETKEKVFSSEEYAKLEKLSSSEQGMELRVTKNFISNLKKGKG